MESQMICNLSEKWNPRMPKGLDWEITQHPLTMKSVVNLIIAMERLKSRGSEMLMSTEFRDDDLLNIMLESVLEEQIVFECFAAPDTDYSRTGEQQCSVTDTEKRNLVRVPESMELHAVLLQGGNDNCKVHLNMSTYEHSVSTAEARTVALGIKDTNLYLSCHKDGDEPTLHLEEVDDVTSLASIGSDSDMVRFLFYRHDTGMNISTLVSVPYSNWYISTAVDDHKPVEMCREDAPRHRTFNIRPVANTPKVECGCSSEARV